MKEIKTTSGNVAFVPQKFIAIRQSRVLQKHCVIDQDLKMIVKIGEGVVIVKKMKLWPMYMMEMCGKRFNKMVIDFLIKCVIMD